MGRGHNGVTQYDEWIRDESDAAALVMRHWLESVEGKDAVVFPPTYTLSDTDAGRRFNGDEPVPGVFKGQKGPYGYNIDVCRDGSSVCQIDSVGSQANRMEPIFKRPRYRNLVPTVTVKVSDQEIDVLDAGHRAADALVRFSNLRNEIDKAFKAVVAGDATLLARLAPTSIVFGAWDSRATQVKLPRIVRSVIRAFDVRPLHRSAQYIPPLNYIERGVLDEPTSKQDKDKMSEHGLSHAPAPWSHGGVLVEREIRREASLNLEALRSLYALDGDRKQSDPLPMQRYILGLSLVAITAPAQTFLREGCQLVPSTDRPSIWKLVSHAGDHQEITVSHGDVFEFAQLAANEFLKGIEPKVGNLNEEDLRETMGQKGERQRAKRARGPAPGGGSAG